MRFRVARQETELQTDHFSQGGRGGIRCVVGIARTPITEQVAVQLATNADDTARHWFLTIEAGIQNALLEHEQGGLRFCSLQIMIAAVLERANDSSPQVFKACGEEIVHDLASGIITTVDPPAFRLFTADIVGLARGIAEDGHLAHPILADALEEAGCDDALVLEHLRTCVDHGPSCWVTTWLLQAHPPDAP